MRNWMLKSGFYLVIIIAIGGCVQNSVGSPSTSILQNNSTATATPFQPINSTATVPPSQQVQNSIFLSPSVPQVWRDEINHIGNLELAMSQDLNGLSLSLSSPISDEQVYGSLLRIYAAVVPFPTVNDEITIDELMGLWEGNIVSERQPGQLLVSPETATMLEELWAVTPATSVTILDSSELLDSAWKSDSAVAIIPFEDLSPRWKVLHINGISPLDKPMDVENYPLSIKYSLVGSKSGDLSAGELAKKILAVLPSTNRDETKMTVLVMSGTTALTRTTAFKINLHGVDYPIEDIKNWFLQADLRHISNEVSFYKDCPDPDPYTSSLRFCSDEKYLQTLKDLGVNVIELTGNHLNDYGAEALANTINIYKDAGMDYFGGGLDITDAQKPLEINSNGNKIAFIGCNVVGPQTDFATETRAGSAPCNFEEYFAQITRLKNEGYIVVATFQHSEIYVYMYDEAYRTYFLDAAAAGADIVQGSQAHFPMGFGFSGNTLIHYGLGNLLFDQMDYPVKGTRREFIDRHIIYNGRYINAELLTALLTDWSRPVPMTGDTRSQFLEDIFAASKLR